MFFVSLILSFLTTKLSQDSHSVIVFHSHPTPIFWQTRPCFYSWASGSTAKVHLTPANQTVLLGTKPFWDCVKRKRETRGKKPPQHGNCQKSHLAAAQIKCRGEWRARRWVPHTGDITNTVALHLPQRLHRDFLKPCFFPREQKVRVSSVHVCPPNHTHWSCVRPVTTLNTLKEENKINNSVKRLLEEREWEKKKTPKNVTTNKYMFFLLSANRLNIRNFYCVTVNVNCLVYAFNSSQVPGTARVFSQSIWIQLPTLLQLAGRGWEIGLYIYFGLRALFSKVHEAPVDLESFFSCQIFHPGTSSKAFTQIGGRSTWLFFYRGLCNILFLF